MRMRSLKLTKPRNALIKQYQRLFDMESVQQVLEDALRALAAIARKTGARGLARSWRAFCRSNV